MTVLVVDVGYSTGADGATLGVVGVVWAGSWTDSVALGELVVEVGDVGAYVPGEFFRRELPCLLAAFDAVRAVPGVGSIDTIVVDGNVRLDADGAPGLGRYLYDAIDGVAAVVGVAKSRFRQLDAVEVFRGTSSRPLFVTAVGVDEEAAAAAVASMAGPYRIPTLLKRADHLSRTG